MIQNVRTLFSKCLGTRFPGPGAQIFACLKHSWITFMIHSWFTLETILLQNTMKYINEISIKGQWHTLGRPYEFIWNTVETSVKTSKKHIFKRALSQLPMNLPQVTIETSSTAKNCWDGIKHYYCTCHDTTLQSVSQVKNEIVTTPAPTTTKCNSTSTHWLGWTFYWLCQLYCFPP